MDRRILLAMFAASSFAIIVLTVFSLQTVYAFVTSGATRSEPKAPMIASGDNLYIVWWTNKSGNWEVMFRASNDADETIGDKINLSNSSDSESQNAEIVAQGDNVFVSWWETNPSNGTSEPVLRISNDNGNTFGPVLMLGTNGTQWWRWSRPRSRCITMNIG